VAAYPVGMLVNLSNGYKAVVIKNHSENNLRPVVRLIDSTGECIKDLDLLHDPDCINITITGRCEDEDNSELAVYVEDEYGGNY